VSGAVVHAGSGLEAGRGGEGRRLRSPLLRAVKQGGEIAVCMQRVPFSAEKDCPPAEEGLRYPVALEEDRLFVRLFN